MENPAKRPKLMSGAVSSDSTISRFFEHNRTYKSSDFYLDSLESEPKSFADCVKWARLNFERNFSLNRCPAAGQNARSRSTIVFDVNNNLHLDYIVVASNLRATSYGIPQLNSREGIAKIVIQLEDNIQEIKFYVELSGERILPNEMWCSVFKHLELDDLKNVSLACKRFHEIIAESTDLMKHFVIDLIGEIDRDSFHQVMFKSIRKYQKVTCEDIYLDLDFFIKNPITWLNFRYISYTEEEFLQIMNAVKDTLEFIDLYDVRFLTESETEPQPIEWKMLKTVNIYDINDRILRYLPLTIESFSTDRFYYFGDEIDAEEIEDYYPIVQFINTQKNLKKLLLLNWFHPNSNETVFKIKLDRLILEHDNANIKFVLQNQFDSLRSLELRGRIKYQRLATVINQMQKLEKLILKDIYFPIPQNEIPTKMFCSMLKSLKFDSVHPNEKRNLKLVLEAFPNLEELDVTDSKVEAVPKLVSKCNPELKRLKIQEFSDFDFAGARLPNLLELIIHGDGKFSKVFKSCPNLKKIVVRSAISESTFRAILKHAKNLKCLIILDGSELPQNTIETIEHLLKNLEELRIYKFKQQTKASNTLLAKHLTLRSYITSEAYPRHLLDS